MKVKELLSDESKWCKGQYARDEYLDPLCYDDSNACQWCLMGAVLKCYEDENNKVLEKIREKLKIIQISVWNDSKDTSFQDVKNLVEELDI